MNAATMNAAPFRRLALPLLTLSLTLAACGGGDPAPGPPPPAPAGTVSSTADSGPGTLRELLGNAKDGDTLKLASGTITLAGPLKVTKNVTLDLGSSVIDAAGKGRTLEIPSGVTVTIKGGTLKGGTGAPITVQSVGKQALSVATYGGVLINEGTLTLDGTAVTGGKANVGGGIANFKTGTLILKGTSSVSDNMADALPAGATAASGVGGGISNTGTVKVEGGRVGSNTAVYNGGGIYNSTGGTVTVSGGSVEGNKCTYPITTTADNTVGCGGGGIYSFGNVTITGGSVSGNTVSLFGGGIALFNLFSTSDTTPRPVLTISGGSIENNKTTGDIDTGGGGIWSNQITNISGGSIKGNSSMFGGGMNNRGTLSVTGGTFEGNTATENGGGIYSSQSSTATMTGGTVQNNTAVKDGGGLAIRGSAGVLNMGGTAKVSGNKARWGGGVLVNDGAKMNLSGGTISGNTAAQTGGGVLDNGTVTMTGGEISGNSVPGSAGDGGGGVRLFAGSTFTASGGSIKNNTASFGGGVKTDEIYQTTPASQFTLSGATISGNTSTENRGGGVHNRGQLTISSGNVTANTAKTQGGGVFNAKVATYSKTGGSVTGNNPDDEFNEP